MDELKITLEKPAESLRILRLQGEFEGMTVLNSKEKLLACLDQNAGVDVVADFSEISYIDSSGVGVLLEMAKTALEKKIKFGLSNVKDSVKKVLKLTKVDQIISIY